jgi:hypothetical protein
VQESTLKNDLMEEAGAEVPLNACAQASQKSTTAAPKLSNPKLVIDVIRTPANA